MMTLPDFSSYGYQVLEKLNQNVQAGRITYKATEIASQNIVVIKQFRFATSADWTAYKQVEREIDVLKGLDHWGIPRYLKCFDSENGICLVQEYKYASNLAVTRTFSAEEVKNIAIQVLEILTYLQNRVPTIIHRDIKPENILYDDQNKKIYLVDFGFARIGSTEVTALSSMVAGTTGFMPPEQLLNKSLSEASDLYGLGATLICLLTGVKSSELSNLVNHNFKINYKPLVSKYSLRFLDWLDQMVEPDQTKRFKNAETALKVLLPLDLIRIPEVNFDKSELNFIANFVGEKLSQTITLSNNIPDTLLEGSWSVSPHPSDPPHTPDSHIWITFSPKYFQDNNVNCLVNVDTSQLKADRDYERKLVLTSNAEPENYELNLKVKTSPINLDISIPPYNLIAVICLILAVLSVILSLASILYPYNNVLLPWIFIFLFIAGISVVMGAICDDGTYTFIWGCICALIGLAGGFIGVIIGFFVGGMIGGITWTCIVNKAEDLIYRRFSQRGFKKKTTALYLSLTMITAYLTGAGVVVGFNPYLFAVLGATALPLAGMLIYPSLKLKKLTAEYRRQESQKLIES